MEDVILIIIIIELFLGVCFLGICIGDDKTPYEMYKSWLKNKNWFGKIYTVIAIIITFPLAIFYYITWLICILFALIYTCGLKDKEK